jgi:hypothetical protein
MFLDYPGIPKLDSLGQPLKEEEEGLDGEKDSNSSEKLRSERPRTNYTHSTFETSLSHQAYPLSSVRVIYHVPLECLFFNNIETDMFSMDFSPFRLQFPYFLTHHSAISPKYTAFLNSFGSFMGIPNFQGNNVIQIVLFLDFSSENGPLQMKLRRQSIGRDISSVRGEPLLSKGCIDTMRYIAELINHGVKNIRFCVVPVMSSFQAAGGKLDPPSDVVMDEDDAVENIPVPQVNKGVLSKVASAFKSLFTNEDKFFKIDESIPRCLQFYRWFLHYSARYSCFEALRLLLYLNQHLGDVFLEDIKFEVTTSPRDHNNPDGF